MKRFEQFPHTADIGMHVYGRDLPELFENAALSMFDVIADLEGMKPTLTHPVEVSAATTEDLIVAWLDELLYRFYTKSIIYSAFKIVEMRSGSLRAEARGRPVGLNRNRLKLEIKAVTYNDLKIRQTADGFAVDIVFDV